jgi:DNA-binding transcriptional regulator YhcF (GntR family)
MKSYVLYKTYVSMDSASFLSVESRRNMKPVTANAPAYQPLYRQIKNLITDSLVSGEWRPGEPIPSEIELASRYSVSQGTVRKAISALAEENLLVRHQGKGTFVASHSEERSQFPYLSIAPDKGALGDLTAQLLELSRVKLDAQSARKLGIAGGGSAFLIRRTLTLDVRVAVFQGADRRDHRQFSLHALQHVRNRVQPSHSLRGRADQGIAGRGGGCRAPGHRGRRPGHGHRPRCLYLRRQSGRASAQLLQHHGASLPKSHCLSVEGRFWPARQSNG